MPPPVYSHSMAPIIPGIKSKLLSLAYETFGAGPCLPSSFISHHSPSHKVLSKLTFFLLLIPIFGSLTLFLSLPWSLSRDCCWVSSNFDLNVTSSKALPEQPTQGSCLVTVYHTVCVRSHWVVSDSAALWTARFLCPRNGIFQVRKLESVANPHILCLLHWQADPLPLIT